jgi:hypothetical protein
MTHRQYLLKNSCGFLTSMEDEEKLIAENRLQSVLVRCGGGRFTCPVQDVGHFRDMINKANIDYIRDISVQ